MKIIDEREKTHGPFAETARLAQALKATFRTGRNWPAMNDAQREALDLRAHKIARILNGDHKEKDHWLDDDGYAYLCEEHKPVVPGSVVYLTPANPIPIQSADDGA